MTLYSGHLVALRREKRVAHPSVAYGISTDSSPVYGAPVSVSCFIDNTDDYDLYYTTDGSDPSSASSLYSGPFTIYASCTVKARAVEKSTGWLNAVRSADFTLSIPVAFEHESLEYFDPFTLEITAPDPAYAIYYSVDGSAPQDGLEYTGPLTVTGTWSVMAVATYAGSVCGPAAGPVIFSRYAHLLLRTRLPMGDDIAVVLDRLTRCGWGELEACDIRVLFLWVRTGGADAFCGAVWDGVGRVDFETLLSFSRVLSLDECNLIPWERVGLVDQDVRAPWETVAEVDSAVALPWMDVAKTDAGARLVWGLLSALGLAGRLEWGRLQPVDLTPRIPWTKMKALDLKSFSGFEKGEATQKEKLISALSRIPWISAARLIMTKQNIVFKRVLDNEPVRILTGSFGIDEDSWDYEFTGVIPSREDLLKIVPNALGTGTGPVLVELAVNGYPARFLIERFSENRQWGKGTYTVYGRSPSCVLGDGYGSLVTQIFTGTNAQQIVASILSGTGFSYSWGLIENTWNINGEFSVCDVPKIQIISEIAKAAGGIVQTSPMGDEIRLLKRHPVSPKNYGSVTPDEFILSGVVSLGGAYQTRPKYNKVVVSGKETGVFLTVVRENTPGDRVAPEIVDPMLTAQAINIERGKAFLNANGYDVQSYTLELPLPESGSGQRPKMLFPCELVEVFDGNETWRGRVTSAEVGFEAAKTRQRVNVERYYV